MYFFHIIKSRYIVFMYTSFCRITSYNVCYTKLLRRVVGAHRQADVGVGRRLPVGGIEADPAQVGDEGFGPGVGGDVAAPERQITGNVAAGVITSYSIHYTKLYEGGGCRPAP